MTKSGSVFVSRDTTHLAADTPPETAIESMFQHHIQVDIHRHRSHRQGNDEKLISQQTWGIGFGFGHDSLNSVKVIYGKLQ